MTLSVLFDQSIAQMWSYTYCESSAVMPQKRYGIIVFTLDGKKNYNVFMSSFYVAFKLLQYDKALLLKKLPKLLGYLCILRVHSFLRNVPTRSMVRKII